MVSETRPLASESEIVLPPEASSGNKSDDRNSGKYWPDGAIDRVAKLQDATPAFLGRRPLHVCPDSDSWYLVSDLFEVAVVRGANPASGRQIERLQIAEFLSARNGPQHELRLSGAWVDTAPSGHQEKPGRRCRAVRRDLLAQLQLRGGFDSRAWCLFRMCRGSDGYALSCAEYIRQKPCVTGGGNRKAFSAFAATALTFINPRDNRGLEHLDVHRVVSAQRAAGTLNTRTGHGRFPNFPFGIKWGTGDIVNRQTQAAQLLVSVPNLY